MRNATSRALDPNDQSVHYPLGHPSYCGSDKLTDAWINDDDLVSCPRCRQNAVRLASNVAASARRGYDQGRAAEFFGALDLLSDATNGDVQTLGEWADGLTPAERTRLLERLLNIAGSIADGMARRAAQGRQA